MKSWIDSDDLYGLAFAAAGGVAISTWVYRDTLLQNPGLSVAGLALVLVITLTLHVVAMLFGYTVLRGALGLVARVSQASDTHLVRSCAIGISFALIVFANLALRISDRLPGTMGETPKAVLYPLALVGLVALATASARSLVAAPPRLRAVATFLVMASGAVLPTWTDAWPVRDPGVPSPTNSNATFPNRVLLVGLDGFDWRLGGRLAAAGELPNLRRLLERGTSGELQPVSWLSPIAWTTAVTGRSPLDHGILNFTGYDLVSQRLTFAEGVGHNTLSLGLQVAERAGMIERRPNSLAARRAPAIWDIATDGGRRVAVVNWILANPAQVVDGHFVSPYALDATVRGDATSISEWLFPGSTADFLDAAVSATRTENPGLPNEDLKELAALRLTEMLIRQDRDLDLVVVYSNLADGRSHEWERTRPTREAHRGPSEPWPRIVDGYRLLDRELGRLVAALDDSWLLVLVSDHGWNYEAGYPGHVFPVPAGAYLFCCENVPAFDTAPNDFVTLDIAPTVLGFMQLPISETMRGQIPFPAVRADVVRVPEYRIEATWPDFLEASLLSGDGNGEQAEDEFLDRLRALGYIQ